MLGFRCLSRFRVEGSEFRVGFEFSVYRNQAF